MAPSRASTHGLILMDSIGCVGVAPAKLEAELALRYGIAAKVIVEGGSWFSYARKSFVAFHWTLEQEYEERAQYDWVLLIGMGTDVYYKEDTHELYGDIKETMLFAEKLCRAPSRVMVVFGASSATWRYRSAFAEMYDARVKRVREHMAAFVSERDGMQFITGESELVYLGDLDLVAVPRIGLHGYPFARDKILYAVARWVQYVLSPGPRAKL